MPNTFIVSDTHFQHKLMETYRPWATIQEHDEALIENWNKRVRPKDKIYHLGDFSMNRKAIREILPRLNGDKVLIRGNHDNEPARFYQAHGFRDVRGVHQMSDMVLTHIPIHPMSVTRWGINVHGHLHDKKVMQPLVEWTGSVKHVPDSRYFCVSVEQIGYTPISVDEIRERIKS